MEAAAAHLLGEHDFRNLCKLDVQRQLTNFKRKILRASITPLADETDETNDRMYVFDLVGTAFLYHQVRHIMAALFLVGSGFEHPKIIAELMNVEEGAEPTHEAGEAYTVVSSKPDYQMADDLPLMLWECGYDESELDWRTYEQDERKSGGIAGGDLHHQVQSIYARSRIHAALDQHFLKAVEVHHPPPPLPFPLEDGSRNWTPRRTSLLEKGLSTYPWEVEHSKGFRSISLCWKGTDWTLLKS
jgi:tRNA pseudouridine38/39 synthase